MQFPSVTGSNLSGQTFALPQDFAGTYNVVLIAYQRFQQSAVDTWGPLLEQLAQRYPELRYYELPTMSKFGWLQRTFIDGGMRAGIPDKAVRARTITLYLDVTTFNEALNISTISDIVVLVVDKTGDVLWRSDGPASSDKANALTRTLATLFAQTAGFQPDDLPDGRNPDQ